MGRIWKIQMNLDDLNALAPLGMTDQMKADLWTGLLCGANGIEIPEESSKCVRSMFDAARSWRAEAEGFRARKSDGGKASAESRRKKFGTAQPRSVFEDSSEDSFEQQPNQSTIYNLTNNTNTAPVAPLPKKKAAKKVYEPIPEAFIAPLEEIKSLWPRKRTNGKYITRIDAQECWNKICKNRLHHEPETVVNAAFCYLESNPDPQYVYGMDNFFGEDRHYTKFVVAAEEG